MLFFFGVIEELLSAVAGKMMFCSFLTVKSLILLCVGWRTTAQLHYFMFAARVACTWHASPCCEPREKNTDERWAHV